MGMFLTIAAVLGGAICIWVIIFRAIKKKPLKSAIVALVVMIALAVVGMIIPDSTDTPASGTTDVGTSQSESAQKVLYDGKIIKATYIEVFEADEVDGAFYLRILVENKGTQKVTIYLDDASVNGYQTTVLSGLPMEIEPGNKSQQPFIITYTNLDVDKLEDVKSIKFKIEAMGDNFEDIEKSGEVEINP
ncbi:MAG: hypothetical protein ACI4JR_09520 [Acutalibacteraceae bacterium]